ncbi:hypothetical protein AMECASPLE_025486 [Ameca splendens]|uniref:Uncharacterized protein n=1 Tax=Ameca splendens TaxID=208324 RepID=A0ABV0XU34_9TELE
MFFNMYWDEEVSGISSEYCVCVFLMCVCMGGAGTSSLLLVLCGCSLMLQLLQPGFSRCSSLCASWWWGAGRGSWDSCGRLGSSGGPGDLVCLFALWGVGSWWWSCGVGLWL